MYLCLQSAMQPYSTLLRILFVFRQHATKVLLITLSDIFKIYLNLMVTFKEENKGMCLQMLATMNL